MVKKKRKKSLAPWVLEIVDQIGSDLTRELFVIKLAEHGKQTEDEKVKQKMRNVYKKLQDDGAYWERKVKKRIQRERGWGIFHSYERGDIPLQERPSKENFRAAHCYKCSGPLYSDIHYKCSDCGWLICPVDSACGCGYGYKSARVDFMS
jgi:hypothetical protein